MAGRFRVGAATQSGTDEGILVAGSPGAKRAGPCETRFCPRIAAGDTACLSNDHQRTEAPFRQAVVWWQIGYEQKLEQLILTPHYALGQRTTWVFIAQGVLPAQYTNSREKLFVFSLTFRGSGLGVLHQPALGIVIWLAHRRCLCHYLSDLGMGFPAVHCMQRDLLVTPV